MLALVARHQLDERVAVAQREREHPLAHRHHVLLGRGAAQVGQLAAPGARRLEGVIDLE